MNTGEAARRFAFAPLNLPVRFFGGAEDLLGSLALLSRGWTFQEVQAGDEGASPLVVRREAGLYRIDAPWLDKPVREHDPFRAAANLAVDLLEACLDENPDMLTVHCATVEMDGRAVLFPASSRAGKSTLAARLAAEGLPVLGDDVIALTGKDAPQAMSFGLFPRPRTPLPDHAGPSFRSFVDRHGNTRSGKYTYLDLPEAQAPWFGRTAPLGAVVLLDRAQDRPASLTRIGAGDGLQELLLQNLSPSLAMGEALPRLVSMLKGVPCLRLGYWNLDEAAARLATLFSNLPPPQDTQSEGAETPAPSPSGRPDLGEATHAGPLFVRRAGIDRLIVDDGSFLVETWSGTVYRLNPVSNALWTLMEHPVSAERSGALLAAAFLDTDGTRIMADVKAHLAEMAGAGLIVESASAGGADQERS